jgi:hypothetical protein
LGTSLLEKQAGKLQEIGIVVYDQNRLIHDDLYRVNYAEKNSKRTSLENG